MPAAPDLLQLNPFHRLATLLAGLAPGRSPLPDGKPVNISVGDPRTTMPAFAGEAMRAAEAAWSRYAPARGHPDYLAAVHAWLNQRYALPADLLDPAKHIVPVAGSREGLFFAVLAAVAAKRAALGGAQPAVLLPDPGYHVYAGATAAAGAEAIYVPAPDGLPDYGAVAPETLKRAALAFVCTPANPQGVVASRTRLTEALRQARQAGYVLAVDECYSEIYTGEAPTGGLEVAAESGSLDGLLVFNSLSKRSGAPGLRLGFIAGDAALIRALEGFLRFGGAGPGVPLLAAGAALWREESHVAANRAYYDRNLQLAERILGNAFGWRRPGGGFFLWLDVSAGRFDDGEAAAKALFTEGGITMLPGAYLSVGRASVAEAPGRRHLRASLAEPPAMLEPVLTRVAEILL